MGWAGRTLVADGHDAGPNELSKTGRDTEDLHGWTGAHENDSAGLGQCNSPSNGLETTAFWGMIESDESHCGSSSLACTGGLVARNHCSHPVATPLLGIVSQEVHAPPRLLLSVGVSNFHVSCPPFDGDGGRLAPPLGSAWVLPRPHLRRIAAALLASLGPPPTADW